MPNFSFYQSKSLGKISFISIIIILFFAIAFDFKKKQWVDWTGFGEEILQIETVEKDSKGNITKVAVTKTPESGKELWDILELCGTLAIPAILAYLGYQIQKREQKTTEENLLEEVLQKYLDDISKLLLETDLSSNVNDNPAQDIGTFKTLTTLRRLDKDADRRLIILLFLYDAKLINKPQKVNLERCNFNQISNYKINLTKVDLTGASFIKANLTEANLEESILFKTNLKEVDFTGANLKGVNFNNAVLNKAILTKTLLQKATFDDTNISEADFRDADISEADFSNALNLNLEQIKKAKNWQLAKYNEHFKQKLGL